MTKTLSLNGFVVRLASLGAVWQQGVIPQEQTTRWTGGPDSLTGITLKNPSNDGQMMHFFISCKILIFIEKACEKSGFYMSSQERKNGI
ncbi:hypothetical protein AB1I68_01040 [Paenibacillus pabuli]|uniref:hypothetical protein n=1 Tax=Paenibacillus pabuli TaxID=1472 RepID=UPI0034581A99